MRYNLNKHLILSILGSVFVFISCQKKEPTPDQKDRFVKYYGDAYINEAVDMLQIDNTIYLLINHTNGDDKQWVKLKCVDLYGNTNWEAAYGNESDINNWAHQLVSYNNNLVIVGTANTDSDSLLTDVNLIIVDPHSYETPLLDTIYNEVDRDEGFCFVERSGGGFLIVGIKDLGGDTEKYHWMFDEDFNFLQAGSNGKTFVEQIGSPKISPNGYIYLPWNGGPSEQNIASITGLNDYGNNTILFPYFGGFEGYYTEVDVQNYPLTIASGTISSGENGGSDAYLSSFNIEDESTKWEINFGSNGSDDGVGFLTTSDGNIYLAGSETRNNNSDIFVFKINELGVAQDTFYFGATDNEYAVKILPDKDNPDGFMVFGTSDRGEYSYSVLVKSQF